MGQEFSKIKFQRQISDCIPLNQFLRHLYRGVSIHVIAETIDSVESARYLLLSRYDLYPQDPEVLNENSEEQTMIMKRMNLEQFRLFKRYILELYKLFTLGATLHSNSSLLNSNIDLNSTSEECPICMEVNVEIVLPCTHSLCNNCYKDWKSHNPSCPFCRVDFNPSDENGGDESWSIEDCDKDMNSIASELYQTTLEFMRNLPTIQPKQSLRIYPPVPSLYQESSEEVRKNSTETDR